MKKHLPTHPNIFVFLNALKIAQAKTEMDISKVEVGVEPPVRKPKLVKFEAKIEESYKKHVDGQITTDRLLSIVRYHTNVCKK